MGFGSRIPEWDVESHDAEFRYCRPTRQQAEPDSCAALFGSLKGGIGRVSFGGPDALMLQLTVVQNRDVGGSRCGPADTFGLPTAGQAFPINSERAGGPELA